MLVEPLTPDFVTYRPCPVNSVAVNGSCLVVTWPDGFTHRFHPLFLAENSGESMIDPVTRERFGDPTTIPVDVTPTSLTVTEVGHIEAEWPDGRVTSVHSGWLRAEAEGHGGVDHDIPARQTWDVATIGGDLPTVDGPPVLTDDEALAKFLRAAVTWGVARLRGLPTDDGTVGRVAERIGVVRDTSFGRLWDVKPKVDSDSIAYSAVSLLPHTDLPTRESPPGFQLLHCRTNDAEGGAGVIVDGFRCAEVLAAEQPEAYANLTTTRWTFTNRSPEYDYRWSGRLIELAEDGTPSEVRHLHSLRTVPDVASDQVEAAYAAVWAFTEVTRRPTIALQSMFAPGDLVMFDNRRMMHGRDAFDPSSGERHLEGCYIDRDEVCSRIRILARRGHRG